MADKFVDFIADKNLVEDWTINGEIINQVIIRESKNQKLVVVVISEMFIAVFCDAEVVKSTGTSVHVWVDDIFSVFHVFDRKEK